jgi:predicted nucleic acid-binding protein
MPEVISNTSPFQYLHQIGCLDFLSKLYQHVIVANAVVNELGQGLALAWVRVEAAAAIDVQRVPQTLGDGERETIALALGRTDPLLILDDAAARSSASALGVRFTGTLGVLVKAKQSGLIAAIRPCLEQLHNHGFYLSASVWANVLRLAGEVA